MIKITIPKNNLAERKYILFVIFEEILGLKYQVIESLVASTWKIELKNNSFLTFEDHFFNNNIDDKEYLNINNIPSKVVFSKNEFSIEENIPIIYGNSTVKKKNNNIHCGIDIFASTFFMLTRWEEYVNKERDEHDRFLSKSSLAFRNGFLDRPIVNEYIEMLKSMILFLDNTICFKKRKFSFYLSHDIDNPIYFNSLKSRLREIYNFFKNNEISEGIKLFLSKLLTHLKLKKDPYDTFDYLMDISEDIGVSSSFFIMGKGSSFYDSNYDLESSFIINLKEKIISRGHTIGIHPSYNSYNNDNLFYKEKSEIEQKLNITINSGRQHYLRFEIPTTWQIWEDNGMKYDSTCGYADKEGFRCGICYEFSVFNILTQKKLDLKEKPLIVMDGSFEKYQKGISSEKMKKRIIYLKEKVKKYDGEFVLLWHNSSFNIKRWKKYNKVYESVAK